MTSSSPQSNSPKEVFGDIHCRKVTAHDDAFLIECTTPLGQHEPTLIDVLKARAEWHPSRPLFHDRGPNGERETLTYGEAWELAHRVGTALLSLGAGEQCPVAVVAENSIRMALLILGAYAASVPVAPISPAYSTMSQDYQKLRYILNMLDPAVLVFDDADNHRGAMQTVDPHRVRTVTLYGTSAGSTSWEDFLGMDPGGRGELPPPNPDTAAKLLFTSGSTGMPKGVVNTQRMMMSNQQALTQIWPVIATPNFRLVDWLPWNHTFGGNQNFNMTLYHGGTLTIDHGKPTPEGLDTTIKAIKSTLPTVYFNVPRGLDVLVEAMLGDPELEAALFQDLELLGYAGAALPEPVWTALRDAAMRVKGREIPIVGLWGSTETGPVATAVYFPNDHAGNIGLPVPGCALKFVLDGSGKREMRVRAPSVTPGYWRQPELAAQMFDEEGFFKIGDAGKLVDEKNVAAGILFDGCLGENFKLTSGTWVNVGALRVALISACPELIADAVIAGHNRDFVSALIFPKMEACRALCQDDNATDAEILRDARVRNRIGDAIAKHNRQHRGSSQRIVRMILLDTPPSVDRNEMTDKGYLNQRAVLENRCEAVERLYDPTASDVVIIQE